MIELTERYATRPVRFLQISERDDWRLKVYGIAYGRERPDATLVDAAVAAGHGQLPTPAATADRYGVGFLGVHQGRAVNFVFVDWWAQENELHHHVWFSEQSQPTALRAWRPEDPIGCAWDLGLVAFEREAWIRNVLTSPADPDLDAYLADQLNDDI
jgi:hypothetical protein